MIPDFSKMAEIGEFVERLDKGLAEILTLSRETASRVRRIEAHLAKQHAQREQEREACD